MPRVESSSIINAPRDRVIAVAQDNEAFPEFMAELMRMGGLVPWVRRRLAEERAAGRL